MIYILLPIYNEAENVSIILNNIKKGMAGRRLPYSVIAYNDGSTDASLGMLQDSISDYPLSIIGKKENEGLGFAYFSLLKEFLRLSESEDDIAITLDSDNTHNPEHIYHMVNKILDGFDVVIASRYQRDSRIVGVSLFRQILSFGASVLMRVLFNMRGVRDYTCGYRAYSKECLRKAFEIYGENLIEEKGFACMAELLIKLRRMGILAIEIPLLLRYDHKGGASKMDIVHTVKKTIAMLIKLKRIGKVYPKLYQPELKNRIENTQKGGTSQEEIPSKL